MDRDEEWQRLIEEYREVPVPSSIRDGIQDAIARGKKRAAKRRRTAYISTAVSGAAAVILILVLFLFIYFLYSCSFCSPDLPAWNLWCCCDC